MKKTSTISHAEQEIVRIGKQMKKFELEEIENKKIAKINQQEQAMARIEAKNKEKVIKMQKAFKDFFDQKAIESKKVNI